MRHLTRCFAILVIGAVLAQTAEAASESDSGNYIERGCRMFARGDVPVPGDLTGLGEMGICVGAINALMWLDKSLPPPFRIFCAPEGAGPGQAAKIIVKFLEAHPGRLNENYHMLMTDALRDAWPCPTPH